MSIFFPVNNRIAYQARLSAVGHFRRVLFPLPFLPLRSKSAIAHIFLKPSYRLDYCHIHTMRIIGYCSDATQIYQDVGVVTKTLISRA